MNNYINTSAQGLVHTYIYIIYIKYIIYDIYKNTPLAVAIHQQARKNKPLSPWVNNTSID